MAKYIVSFENNAFKDSDSAKTHIQENNGKVLRDLAFDFTYSVEIKRTDLKKLSGIRHAELETKKLKTESVFDINHLEDIVNEPGENKPWAPLNTGAGETVYLIDTGVDESHSEFAHTQIDHLYTAHNTHNDLAGHGTAVASLIVGKNIGVSPHAQLKNVKLFDTVNGEITVAEIIDALDSILVDHQLASSTVKVVCMPWIIEKNQLVDDKLSQLIDHNLLAVAAAGNNGTEVNEVSPAGLNPVLTVGSYHSDYNVAEFTNLPFCEPPVPTLKANEVDIEIDVFALGVGVKVADIHSGNFAEAAGTSVSAGLVAGAALQWISAYSTYTASKIRSILVNEGSQKGTSLLDFSNVSAPSDLEIDYSKISFSTITVPQANQLALPSGRLLDLSQDDQQEVDLDLNPNAQDVAELPFAPAPPWITVDLSTGKVQIDPASSGRTDLAPGVYNFGIKGSVGGRILVEEYSVGVYELDPSELDSSPEYYYDAENQDYEKVVTYQGASTPIKF